LASRRSWRAPCIALSPGRHPPSSSEIELARAAAENVLHANCGQCHGPALTLAAARAGMNDIDDIDALVDNGKLIPLDSARSAVVRRMREGSMPPPGTFGPERVTRSARRRAASRFDSGPGARDAYHPHLRLQRPPFHEIFTCCGASTWYSSSIHGFTGDRVEIEWGGSAVCR
jgi:hypothetical protein